MNDMLFFLISECLFIATFRVAMGIFFVKKNMPCYYVYILWIVYCLLDIMGAKYLTKPIIHILWEMVGSFFLCVLLYYGSIRKKLMWIVMFNLMGMVTETIIGYIYFFMNVQFSQINILGSFVSKILLLMILAIMKGLSHSRLKNDIPLLYWCILFSIPIASIFVLNTLFSLCESSSDENAPVFSMVSSAFIFSINFILLRLYEDLSERLEFQKQQIIFDKQIELCKNQIHEREESNLNIKSIKHDIENHLICIMEYLERRDLELAQKYVGGLLKGDNYLTNKLYIDSGNIVIDALLNYKSSVMEQSKIKLLKHIEIPYKLDFNDADLCIVLSNCLDNSIEAVNKISDESRRIINIEIIYRKNSLLIKISNPYEGIVKKDKSGNYITTKNDKQNHGIGLISVKKAVQKYDGLIDIKANESIFIVQILLYSPSKNYI